jgi:hypothetical protein
MFLVDAIGVNQVRGLPFRVDELVTAVRSVIDGTAVRTKIGSAGRFGTMNGVPTIEVGIQEPAIPYDSLSGDLSVSSNTVDKDAVGIETAGTNGASR